MFFLRTENFNILDTSVPSRLLFAQRTPGNSKLDGSKVFKSIECALFARMAPAIFKRDQEALNTSRYLSSGSFSTGSCSS